MNLQRSSNTFTAAYLDTLCRDAQAKGVAPSPLSVSTSHLVLDHVDFGSGTGYESRAIPFVHELLGSQVLAGDHFRHVDRTTSTLLLVHLRIPSKVAKPTDIVQKALDILERMPAIPNEKSNPYVFLHSKGVPDVTGYVNETNQNRINRPGLPWDNLQVVTRVSTVTLKLSLAVATCFYASANEAIQIGSCIRRFVDNLARLRAAADLAGISQMNTQGRAPELRMACTEAFLWTTWVRCSHLLSWLALDQQLRFGYDARWEFTLGVNDTGAKLPAYFEDKLLDKAIAAVPQAAEQMFPSPYMCRWAYRLLRSAGPQDAFDYRHFRQRFRDGHPNKPARCLFKNPKEACKGDSPLTCGRFTDKQLVAGDQSVHCCRDGKCSRMTWKEKDYLAIKGPVAVVADQKSSSSSKHVQYKRATTLSMAITHVWSHGHGGRPSTGINKCLHDRLSRLAISQGCDSYWFDVMCIPEAHALRHEAIRYINTVFAQSKAVLILDKDLMSLSGSRQSVQAMEILFSTLLVCDWNVRAWTMLEAIKSSGSLHILCKNDEVVPLHHCINTVHRQGRIDLAILALSTQHLLPPSKHNPPAASPQRSVEQAGSILSHRHATRQSDEIVIWSLMSNTALHTSAEAMWKSLVGSRIKTAFLVSDAARVQLRGFTWAPATPYARKPVAVASTQQSTAPVLVFDGFGSQEAQITPQGLQGYWNVYHYDPKDAAKYRTSAVVSLTYQKPANRDPPPNDSVTYSADGKERAPRPRNDNRGQLTMMVDEGKRTVNECWRVAAELAKKHRHVCLLQPLAQSSGKGFKVLTGSKEPGEQRGAVFVVCASENKTHWTWEGVADWASSMEGPNMKSETLLII